MDTDVQGRFGSRWHLPPCSQPPYSRPPLPPRRGSPTRERRRSSFAARRSSRPGRPSWGRPWAACRRSRTPAARASTSISDDQANARFYKLRARISDGELANDDITFTSVTTLKQPDGTPYPTGSLDPEGFTLTKHSRKAIITSEGFANRLINPWIRVYRLDGSYVRDVPVAAEFNPNAAGTQGVRLNLGFEAAATRGKHLYTGTENALVQDGPAASLATGSPVRILEYDLKRNTLRREWRYYQTDPIAEPFTGFGVNGLVEVLPLGNRRLLTMERSFSVGAPDTGNTIKLFVTELRNDGTTSKTLLLNLDTLGIPLDNVEGMTFGPRLRGGKRTLLLVSDNNFAAAQFTQFLLFAVDSGHGHKR